MMHMETKECSEDYPIGGMIEPYDMEAELELMSAGEEMKETAQRRMMLKPVCRWNFPMPSIAPSNITVALVAVSFIALFLFTGLQA